MSPAPAAHGSPGEGWSANHGSRHNTTGPKSTTNRASSGEVELNTLASELLVVVDQTMQPASASLWLRPPPDHARPLSAIDK